MVAFQRAHRRNPQAGAKYEDLWIPCEEHSVEYMVEADGQTVNGKNEVTFPDPIQVTEGKNVAVLPNLPEGAEVAWKVIPSQACQKQGALMGDEKFHEFVVAGGAGGASELVAGDNDDNDSDDNDGGDDDGGDDDVTDGDDDDNASSDNTDDESNDAEYYNDYGSAVEQGPICPTSGSMTPVKLGGEGSSCLDGYLCKGPRVPIPTGQFKKNGQPKTSKAMGNLKKNGATPEECAVLCESHSNCKVAMWRWKSGSKEDFGEPGSGSGSGECSALAKCTQSKKAPGGKLFRVWTSPAYTQSLPSNSYVAPS